MRPMTLSLRYIGCQLNFLYSSFVVVFGFEDLLWWPMVDINKIERVFTDLTTVNKWVVIITFSALFFLVCCCCLICWCCYCRAKGQSQKAVEALPPVVVTEAPTQYSDHRQKRKRRRKRKS